MKIATLKDGSRDGQLVVVSRDLMSAHYATGIADRMQQALDDWNFISPQLQDLYDTLNHGKARHAFVFEARQCMAPLPRAYLLAVGDAYAIQPSAHPPLAPARLDFSDPLHGPCGPLFTDARHTLDFAAALAVVTADIPRLSSPGQALDGVRLLMLANHVQVRTAADHTETPPGDALFCAFSPVAVTPDELVWRGSSVWQNGRLNLNLQCKLNGRSVGKGNMGDSMGTPFGELLAGLCQSRRLCAGSIVSSGEVRFADAASGFCSVAARRAFEASQTDAAQTTWLTAGDALHLDVTGPDGQSVFGAIAQAVAAAG
jgi:fumarylacetoacetate (FAA) hydrolase